LRFIMVAGGWKMLEFFLSHQDRPAGLPARSEAEDRYTIPPLATTRPHQATGGGIPRFPASAGAVYRVYLLICRWSALSLCRRYQWRRTGRSSNWSFWPSTRPPRSPAGANGRGIRVK
jgi:hypothetical protein